MLSIVVVDSSGVGEARRRVSYIAQEFGFPETEIANLAIIVAEAANNLIKHTPNGGKIVISPVQLDEQHKSINIWALDKGKGITNFSQSMQDGYSTAGTQGIGLGAIKRLSSAFEIYSIPDLGTILWAQIIIHLPSMKKVSSAMYMKSYDCPFDIGIISVPIKGEDVCGDGYAFNLKHPTNKLFMVVDGLGHGVGAFEAAHEAIRLFNTQSSNLNLEALLQKMHLSLNKTRGAALTLIKLNLVEKELEHIGIGNISSVILNKDESKHLVTLNGIVGHGIKKMQSFKKLLPKNFILIMHSDGIITHWDLDEYPGIMHHSSSIIAGLLYRDYERGRDDATVLVIREHSMREL